MKKEIIVLGLVFFLINMLLGVIIWLFKGTQTFLKFLMFWTIGMCVIGILALIIVTVLWLFKPKRIDGIELNKEKIIKAGKLNAPTFRQELYFKGSEEWEYKRIGFIEGLCRVKSIIGRESKKSKEVEEDCILFKKSDGLFSFLLPMQIVRVKRNERTSLNADKVFLKAMSFTPEVFGFLFLPNRFREEEYAEVEKIATGEIRRYSLQEVLKEEINIIQDAIAISPRHQKELEKQNMQTVIPMPPQVEKFTGGGK